jgi:hypothetical protein
MYINKLVKKQLLLTIITVILIGTLIATSSYALFETTASNPTDQTMSIGDLNVTFTGSSAISVTSIEPMTDATALTQSNNTYTFTINNTGTVAYTYNIKLNDNPAYLSGGANYNASMVLLSHNYIRYSLYDAAVYTLGSKTNNQIYEGIINAGATKSFTLRLWVADAQTYSLPNSALNSEIHLNIDVTGKASGSLVAKPGIASTSIMNLGNKQMETGGLKSISHDATGNQTYATTDYRYYGSNPNNYVTFNDELWRIIGVFEVEDDTGTKAYRVKLIRNNFLGAYSYDTTASTVNSGYGINEWSQSDIMKLLNPGYESNQDLNNSGSTITVNNSLYWTKGSGTCYNGESNKTTTCDFTSTGLGATAKSMVDKTKFYLGGWNSSNLTSTQFYTYERSTNIVVPGTSCSGTYCNDTVTRTTTWTGYVALPYVSDYGYATDESLCLNTEYVGYNTTTGYYPHAYCHNNDWLQKNTTSYLTLVPETDAANKVLSQYHNGGVVGMSVENSGIIDLLYEFPVLYLKSSIKISGGSGIQTDPYTLSL